MKDQIISFTETLKSNQNIFSFDEASTKQAIVLRILYFLGWDTFNVEEVTPEYSVKSTRVDYSLRLNDANKAFVEVKKTSEELDNHQEQLLNYSFQEGVKLSILTNGVTWWFYLPLNEGGWEERRFYSIDLIQQEPEDIAQKFIDFLSKDNIYNGKAIKNAEAIYKSQQKKNVIKDTLPKAWNKIISEPDEFLVELLNETTEKICGYRPETELIESFLAKNRDNWLTSDMSLPKKKKFLPKKPSKETSPLKKEKIKLSDNYTGKSISSFSFKSKTYEVNYWIDMLITLCDVIISTHGKDFDKVLGLVGRKRPYFSRNASELRVPQKIEKTNIYVETNLSSNDIVKMCIKILSLFGYTSENLKITSQ